MWTTVFEFVTFTSVFLCLYHEPGHAFNIYIDPANANELIHDDVSMSCRLDNSDADVREIMVLELSRNDVEIALLRLNSQLTVGRGMESKFEADGTISTGSAVYDSHINVTLSDPEVKDSGSYTCFMFYLNQDGSLHEKRQSANLTVSDLDTKSAIKYLVDKVTGLEHELRDREETETKLQGQITSLDNQNKALEEKDALLRSQLTSLQAKVKELVQVTRCPANWKYFKNSDSCLGGFVDKKTFSAARQFCRNEGGDLVKIDSQAKHNFVVQSLFPSGFFNIWIGVWDQKHTRHWTYVDGSTLTFSRWRTGQPDDASHAEACGQIWINGWWFDDRCEKSCAFACEMGARIK